jgi:hypothetical protein
MQLGPQPHRQRLESLSRFERLHLVIDVREPAKDSLQERPVVENPFAAVVRLTGMTQTLIHYKTKSEKTEENKRLIQDVFRELHAASPEGVRYLSFSDDEGNFFHFVTVQDEDNPIPKLEAFKRFQAEIKNRCAEGPEFHEVTIVGNYRVLGDVK